MDIADKVPELVACLWDATITGQLSWEPHRVFDAFSTTKDGVKYTVDRTDSTPWLAVEGVVVWWGSELNSFFQMISERFTPPKSPPPPYQPDTRIPDVVERALKTFPKK